MDFKQFYKEIIFDIDNHMNTLYSAKQGDTKSRGFYVTLTQNNIVVPVTTQSMTFYAEKPDGTRVFQNAIVDGDKFRIDISNQVFAVAGKVRCELALRGPDGESISSKTFQMVVDKQLAEDSIVSEDERGVIDHALDFVIKYVPRMELIDVEMLEGYQGAITTVANNLASHKEDYATLEGMVTGVIDGDITNVLNNELVATDIANKLNSKEIEYTPRMTSVETLQSDYTRLKTYASNITRDNFFNGDPKSVASAWSDRQILLLGDSHAWGEGSPNYQGITGGGNVHMPWIHNAGFYGRLLKFFNEKMDSEPWRVIPLYDKTNPISKTGAGAIANIGAYTSRDSAVVNKDTFTRKPRIVKGKYYITAEGYTDANTTGKTALKAFANAETREDSYAQSTYGYNADIGLFGKGVLTFAPDAGETCVLYDMDKPSRYAMVHLRSGVITGAKVKIELLDDAQHSNDGTENHNQVTTNFGSVYYGTAIPTVHVLSVNGDNTSALVSAPNATVSGSHIEIDTSTTGMNSEAVYIIDFKQKKKGALRMKHSGQGVNSTLSNTILGDRTVATRGVLFGNRDLVRNWGLGGHTIGAWLGLEESYSVETRNHVADFKAYMTGEIKGAIIEIPLVNEWLKQTPIETFKTRLSQLITDIETDNVLVFTTLGVNSAEFVNDTRAIKTNTYVLAVQEWTELQGGNVTFLDARKALKNLVNSGTVEDYNNLWINSGHPSPLANELTFEMLKKVVDLKF